MQLSDSILEGRMSRSFQSSHHQWDIFLQHVSKNNCANSLQESSLFSLCSRERYQWKFKPCSFKSFDTHHSACPSIHSFTHLSIYPFTLSSSLYLFVIHPSIHSFICLFFHSFIHSSIQPSFHPSIQSCICPPIHHPFMFYPSTLPSTYSSYILHLSIHAFHKHVYDEHCAKSLEAVGKWCWQNTTTVLP